VAKSEKDNPILIFSAAGAAPPQPARAMDAMTIKENTAIKTRFDFILFLLLGLFF
jgi:hypothetical protein